MRFLIGLLLGFAIGAGLGLLMAPQAGEETRKTLGRMRQHSEGFEEL